MRGTRRIGQQKLRTRVRGVWRVCDATSTFVVLSLARSVQLRGDQGVAGVADDSCDAQHRSVTLMLRSC